MTLREVGPHIDSFETNMQKNWLERSDEFKLASAEIIASFVLADGIAHEAELELVRREAERLGTPYELFQSSLRAVADDPVGHLRACLSYIVDPKERELITALLFEIATADGEFHENEKMLLNLIEDEWGVSVSFLNRPLEWDEKQLEVISAEPEERIQVSAGPGMGKTAVACARVSFLVEEFDVSDTNIWMISFTRTAVGELRDRISMLAEDPSQVFAAKIATLDSQAWRIRYGFSKTEAEKLFGGFDTGIEQAIGLIDERENEVRDALSSMEHLIIDEAQDITGVRAQFLLKMIELLPADCGITIFYDPAQAIYDYSIEGDTTRLTDEIPDEWKRIALSKIFRTEDPKLLRLYEELRLDIIGNTDSNKAEFKDRINTVKDSAHQVVGGSYNHSNFCDVADPLVLFRRRAQVLQASAFMASDGVPHRLRMSGFPRSIKPWIGATLSGIEDRLIDWQIFSARLASAAKAAPWLLDADLSEFGDMQWSRLRSHGLVREGLLDLWKLRDRLAVSPPDEFLDYEIGVAGPTLGTIHASKGREADNVILQIDSSWESQSGERTNLDEEARVLFVGASRARENLQVHSGLAIPFASQLESGRCYRNSPRKKNQVQFEVGRDGDFEAQSILGRLKTHEDVIDLISQQTPFVCDAEQMHGGDWSFILTDRSGRSLGRLSQEINRAFFEIARIHNGDVGRKPPSRIRHLTVLGFGTAVAQLTNNEPAAGVHSPVARSGIWLVPQIVGFPATWLRWR